jgi:hypothetical protein
MTVPLAGFASYARHFRKAERCETLYLRRTRMAEIDDP